MDGDLTARMSFLQAQLTERVQRSRKLSERARLLGRELDAHAAAASARSDEHLDRLAMRLPRRFGLSPPGGDRSAGEELEFLLALAGAVYPGACACSATAVPVTRTRRPRWPPHDPPAPAASAVPSRAAFLSMFTPARTVGTIAHDAPDLEARAIGADAIEAELADAAQYAVGEGPCLDAVELDQVAVLTAPDLHAEPALSAWPHVGPVLLHLGVRATVSIAIPWSRRWSGRSGAGATAVAALNLYARTAHALDRPESLGLLLGAYAGSRLTDRTPSEVVDAAILRPRWTPPGWEDPDPHDPESQTPGREPR